MAVRSRRNSGEIVYDFDDIIGGTGVGGISGIHDAFDIFDEDWESGTV
jgi:hypothetical protein